MIIKDTFKNLIPPLTDEEFEQLEQNCLNDGIREPLIIWNGILIDGHNRLKISQKHSLPYQTKEMHFDNEKEAEAWIIKNQFGRRNLSAYDRSVLALKLKPLIAEKAKEKQVETLRQNMTVSQKSDERKEVSTKKELAKIAGVSHDTIAKVEKIERQATPEVKAQVKNGTLSINQAYQTVRREEKKRVVEQKIEEHASVQTGTTDIFTTDKKYNIIYADPAWKYWESGNKNQSLHYKTMTIEEICSLPVKNIADDDCVLFLWVTYPILQQAFDVIKAWGFEYSTAAFVWVKKNRQQDTPFVGCGSWTRANSELCLLATKGNIMRLDASVSQIIEAPIEEHSKKPDIVREQIVRLVGKLPRIELFCRNPAEGWDVWGNEA